MAKSNEFQREVGSFLSDMFTVSYRIDDAAYNRYGQRQVSQKPFDFFGSASDGVLFGVEAKRTKSPRLPFTEIKPHQRYNLTKLHHNNNYSWLFINWRIDRRGGKAIWIPYHIYQDIEDMLYLDGIKSVKPEHISEEFFLNRKTGGWNICEYFERSTII